MLKPSIHAGFGIFLFVWLSLQIRCANIQKSPHKTAKNSFWTPMSIFLSLLSCHNTRLHRRWALDTPMSNVDAPYYRNLCISGRILWILLLNDSASDTIPRVWERSKRIPWPHCDTVCQKEKRTAPHEVFWAVSERQRQCIVYLGRCGKSNPPPAYGLHKLTEKWM